MWARILNAWLTFLYPPHCLLCKKALRQQPGLCHLCAEVAGCTTHERGVELRLEGVAVYVLKEFNDEIRQLIHLLKYRGKVLPGRLLGRALGHCLSRRLEINKDWIVLPIPLHTARTRERGYNQSTIIARALAKELGLNVLEKTLKRDRYTPSQTRLNRENRYQNVAGAFRVKDAKDIVGRQIVLVDDVVTTGATSRACWEALCMAGAQRVVVAAVARPDFGDD
ncbi:MAG: ComF family protein [Candidatus Latescibacteria bacterium]|jgi:ComF family protein|nr:ComF family protein [Candidatus Latescibacterota bacterium]MBT4140033.1 ComF family protein [Candidatus Latescibacterota bacterium]MBT5831898.1 ComF family protein [Candidatus Latescibacterota bacterium]